MTTSEKVAAEEEGERGALVGSVDLEHLPLSAIVALVASSRPAPPQCISSAVRGLAGIAARPRVASAPIRGVRAPAQRESAPALDVDLARALHDELAPALGVERSPSQAVRLAELARSSAQRIAVHFGVDEEAALRVAAAFELGRRVERSKRDTTQSLREPSAVHALMLPELRGVQRECFHVLLLDGKHRLKRRERISEGTLTQSLVHPREVFGLALRECAAALIVVHNHPSGDPEPSREDLLVTRRLIETGEIMGIPLIDHVVVADESFVSLRERMTFA